MKKRFLIKLVCKATQDNPTFAGETHIYYYGKEQKVLVSAGSHLEHENYNLIDYMLEDYGYKRECDARRSYIYKTYKTPEDHLPGRHYWDYQVGIIEIVQ